MRGFVGEGFIPSRANAPTPYDRIREVSLRKGGTFLARVSAIESRFIDCKAKSTGWVGGIPNS